MSNQPSNLTDNTANKIKGGELTTLAGHRDSVRSVAFDPTGRFVATGSDDKTAKVWRISQDKDGIKATCVATLVGHINGVRSVAFDPTGRFVATGSDDKTAKVWRISPDHTVATCVATLAGHSNYVMSVAFDPTGRFVATGSLDKTAKIWNVPSDGSDLIQARAIVSRRHFFYEASATCVATLVGHAELVQSVAFDPTGRFLATGSFDKTAKVWDISSDGTGTTCVATLVGHTDVVTSVAFDPTGCFVATGSWDKTAKIWDISSDGTGTTCVATLEGHDRIVTSVTFHPSAPYFATGSWDKTAKLWKLTSKGNERYVECVSTLKHDTYVNSVAFDPTGRFLVTGCYDNTARLWDCHLLLPSERLKLLAMGQSVIEGLVTDNPHLDERRKMSRSLTEHILPPGPSQKWTDPPSFNKDKIEVNREVKTKHIKEAPVTMEEVNGGRMSRRKHKRISRKYKKRALRRSRK
jgi:WD40 repeat protein